MTNRVQNIQTFIDIATILFQSDALSEPARNVAARVFGKLRVASDDGARHRARFPACEWLDVTLAPLIDEDSDFGLFAKALKALEPTLGWNRRTTGAHGSENFIEGHVNGMICGPGGSESRYDVRLGFTIMVPHVRYPDHNHLPEEAYVLLSPGEFSQGHGTWQDPGFGRGIHNLPGESHAMRSGEKSFLALWCSI